MDKETDGTIERQGEYSILPPTSMGRGTNMPMVLFWFVLLWLDNQFLADSFDLRLIL